MDSGYSDLESAIERAIDRCIEDNVLRQFLTERRSEVVKVVQLDYTFERQIILEREAGRADGLADGIAQGISQGISQGIISILEEKGEIPDELCTKIKNEKDTSRLNMWLKAAAAASNVSEFREKCNL